jgi:hypothetical protein
MEPVFSLIVAATYLAAALLALTGRLRLNGTAIAEWFDDGIGVSGHELGIAFESRKGRSVRGRKGDYDLFLTVHAVTLQQAEEAIPDVLSVRLTCKRLPWSLTFKKDPGTGADFLTGDPVFDSAVLVEGEPAVLAALLDERMRQRLLRLLAWDGFVEKGTIYWRASVAGADGELTQVLADVLEMADLILAPGAGVCARLAQNVRTDKVHPVRLTNLSLLQQHFREQPETVEASRAALADSDAWVRLAAARFLKAESLPALRGLVQDRVTPDEAVAEAVALLAARLPAAETGALLMGVLAKRAGQARGRAIQELGRIRYLPAIEALCTLLDEGDARAATALGSIGGATAEEHLVKALDGKRERRLTAARALGACGGIGAVEPLLRLAGNKRIDAEVRQSVRNAIVAIQARAAGAEAGQLSISAPGSETGRLSLAAPKAGEGDVSIAAPPEPEPRA